MICAFFVVRNCIKKYTIFVKYVKLLMFGFGKKIYKGYQIKMVYQELINKGELQRLQDEFSSAAGILAYGLDAAGRRFTNLSGAEALKREFKEYLASGRVQNVLERVEDGSLEDLAVEEVDEINGMIAAIAVRVEEETLFYWILMCADRQTERMRFYRIADFVRDASYTLIVNKILCFQAQTECRHCQSAQQEMSRDLHTIEATAAIVQLLDSDEPIEGIIAKWLRVLGEYLQVDTAQVFRLHTDDTLMDVVCEWRKKGMVSLFDMTSNLPVFHFLQTSKPLVLSPDGSGSEYQAELAELGIKAAMTFPLNRHKNGQGMVMSLNHRKEKHIWSMKEIKFISDAVKMLQSILTKRMQKTSLADSHAALKATLDNVGCSVYVADKKTQEMLFANRKLQNTFARELQNGSFQKLIYKGVNGDRKSGSFEIFLEEKERWYDLLYKEIVWIDARMATLYSLYDITDKKIYQRKIEKQAYTDFLTGLYNRMCCERDLARQIDEAKKNGETGAILYLDLDDFKHINDGLGHQYGDVLLKAISHALKSIKGIQKTCYRMGGDEFVVMISPRYFSEFERIIDEIKMIFTKPWYLKDADYYCTMSMGIVTFPGAGDSVADLIKKADIAMYEAKKGGKNRIATYQDGNDFASGRRLSMEKNMRDATVAGYKEFEVYYQPIINVETGGKQCAGAEALIRWKSKTLGFIPPTEFIPLAEYLGLINPIGNFVLKEACAHCRAWNDNGFPDYKVSVNLSVIQLLQNDIVKIVKKTLKETKVNPKNLTLEVTESLAINDMERMKEILNKIKALGVQIALDDFGTGYSSLNHIREIPIDVIKVDQSFVKDLAEDPYSQSFIKMIAELGETIGVSICVEGIETREQYEVLQGMKVKYIQGYYFDRPMERMKFEEKYVS